MNKKSLPASSVDNTSPRNASTADTFDDACNGTATSMNSGEKNSLSDRKRKSLRTDDEELPSKRARSNKEEIGLGHVPQRAIGMGKGSTYAAVKDVQIKPYKYKEECVLDTC